MTIEEKNWTDILRDCRLNEWDRLPDLELYMDQVIGYMEKQLAVYGIGDAKTLTPSMINNYVKEGVIPRPEHKKYNRTHLAMLTMICAFKQIMPIADIKKLLDEQNAVSMEQSYNSFCETQERALTEMAQAVSNAGEDERTALAARLIAEAEARKIAAQYLLRGNEESEQQKKK